MDEIKKGAWSPEEDQKLKAYIKKYGIWNWSQMPKFAGLSRTGKSCRLRWMNYLNPDVKRGPFSMEEVEILIKTYQELGNRWSTIAARLPGRTDNEVKNFFHTHLKKHMRLKNDHALTKKKARSKRVMKKTRENEKTNTGKAQERPAVEVVPTKIPMIGSSSNKNSPSPNSSSSQCNSIITCQENPTDQDCYNNIISSSRVDQPIIMNMESPFILESNPETCESSLGDTNCNQLIHQFDQYPHDSCNTISDGSSFFDSFDQFDMSSFWFDVLMDAQHLNF